MRANGVDVAELNLSDRLEFYARAWVKQDDGTLRAAFSDDAAVAMAAKGIETACYEWWPDVVVIVSGFFIPPKLWGCSPAAPITSSTGAPNPRTRTTGRPPPPATPTPSSSTTRPTSSSTGPTSTRARSTCRTPTTPTSTIPGPPTPTWPVTSCSSAPGSRPASNGSSRSTGPGSTPGSPATGTWSTDDSPLIPLLMHERGHCIDNADTAGLYRSAKASANLYRQEHSDGAHADGWAIGPREVELAACGTFFFRDPRGEGDELFPTLPIVTDRKRSATSCGGGCPTTPIRDAAVDAARLAVADRTFENTTARLLDLVEAAGRKIAA